MTSEWDAQLRFLSDRIDGIADPLDRLEVLDELRSVMRELLTTQTERACWDLRRQDRSREAMHLLSLDAIHDYAVRWNGRLKGRDRIRWNDPFRGHRREQFRDLTKV